MKINCWYKNGSLKSLHTFCIQNRHRPVSVKLTNRSEPIKGALHGYQLDSSGTAGIFLLLTDKVVHPAYYGIEDIESLHDGHSAALFPWADGMSPPFRDRAAEASSSGCSDP